MSPEARPTTTTQPTRCYFLTQASRLCSPPRCPPAIHTAPSSAGVNRNEKPGGSDDEINLKKCEQESVEPEVSAVHAHPRVRSEGVVNLDFYPADSGTFTGPVTRPFEWLNTSG